MKRIAKFFDFRLNVTHILRSFGVYVLFCLKFACCRFCCCCCSFVHSFIHSALSVSSCRIYQKAKNNFCSVRLFSVVSSVNCNRWKLAIWKRDSGLFAKRCTISYVGIQRWHFLKEQYKLQKHKRTSTRYVTALLNELMSFYCKLSAYSFSIRPIWPSFWHSLIIILSNILICSPLLSQYWTIFISWWLSNYYFKIIWFV